LAAMVARFVTAAASYNASLQGPVRASTRSRLPVSAATWAMASSAAVCP
jgi:hypothetical protein